MIKSGSSTRAALVWQRVWVGTGVRWGGGVSLHSGRTHLLATGRQGKGQLRREGALAHATLAGKHEDDMAHGAQAGGNRSKVGVGPGGRSGAGGLVGAALAGGRAACLPTGSPGAVCKRGQGAAGWRMSCNAIELWPGKSHRDGCGNCANQHTFICVCGDFCRSCHRHRRELLRGNLSREREMGLLSA